MTDLKINGLAELQKLLDELPARIEANVVRGGVRAGARVIADEAKRLCPIGGVENSTRAGEQPGALRDSIRVSAKSQRGRVTATIKAGGKNGVFYAGMVEYGTARHLIKPKNRKSLLLAGVAREAVQHPGAKKKPFMRPALDGKAADAVETMADYARTRLPLEIEKMK
ncbi:MAG: HK97 gp10 family phage protein [Gallionella sp.]|jgi:HK97 gp10 family phage protein|nr:HK97 gp10 family phage protein [Gallionella sp.]